MTEPTLDEIRAYVAAHKHAALGRTDEGTATEALNMLEAIAQSNGCDDCDNREILQCEKADFQSALEAERAAHERTKAKLRELVEAAMPVREILIKHIYPQPDKPDSNWAKAHRFMDVLDACERQALAAAEADDAGM